MNKKYTKRRVKGSNKNRSKNMHRFSGKVTSSSSLSSLIAPKSISQTRKDIGDWNKAQKMAYLVENPKWYLLQQLLRDIFKDALLTSQYKNRVLKALSRKGALYKPNGEMDEQQTKLIQNALFTNEINEHILDSKYLYVSLIELNINELNPEELDIDLIPRDNIDPVNGFLYPDYTQDKKINYREQKEYGTWLLEFGDKGKTGLLNKAVPHVLFKRFAHSCYSELCEIYGIPPRVMKTNTRDPQAMKRGEQMMRDMGSAAWFIIDEDEQFEFAQGVSTNGDVYKNLMQICNNELSLLISGVIIGQDTKNGSRSKDQVALEMLEALVKSDQQLIKREWNSKIIPALKTIGIIKSDVVYDYPPTENIGELWERTKEVLQFKNVDDTWLKEKFGIEITGDRIQPNNQQLKFNQDDFFG